jgi:hypothetical protein
MQNSTPFLQIESSSGVALQRGFGIVPPMSAGGNATTWASSRSRARRRGVVAPLPLSLQFAASKG